MKRRIRGPATLLASFFFVLSSCASPVYAAGETMERDGETLLIRTYTAESNVPRDEVIEQNITRDGISYTMRDVQTTALPQREEKRTATRTVKTESDTDDPERLAALFEPEIPHEADGFTGTLTLDPDSIEAEPGESVPYSYAITDEQQYCGLERDDPALIPKTLEKNGVVLGLSGIEWTRTEEPDGSVWYAAAASYAGTASGMAAGKYTVSAVYSGEIMKMVDGGIEYKVTYGPASPPATVSESVTAMAPVSAAEPEESPAEPKPPEPEPEPESEPQAPSAGWKPVLVIGIPAAALAAAAIVAILRREQISAAFHKWTSKEEQDEDDDELFPVHQEGGKMRIPRAMRCMDRAADEEGGIE